MMATTEEQILRARYRMVAAYEVENMLQTFIDRVK
jgi:hypothetical protein